MCIAYALIIDDNLLNSDLLEMNQCLSTSVNSVHQLHNELSKQDQYDVVFLDLDLVSHDGILLLQELRTQLPNAAIPVIAYSVHTWAVDKTCEAGFDGFIAIPLNVIRFKAQIEQLRRGEAV